VATAAAVLLLRPDVRCPVPSMRLAPARPEAAMIHTTRRKSGVEDHFGNVTKMVTVAFGRA
jgi:hypothetical protein